MIQTSSTQYPLSCPLHNPLVIHMEWYRLRPPSIPFPVPCITFQWFKMNADWKSLQTPSTQDPLSCPLYNLSMIQNKLQNGWVLLQFNTPFPFPCITHEWFRINADWIRVQIPSIQDLLSCPLGNPLVIQSECRLDTVTDPINPIPPFPVSYTHLTLPTKVNV